MVASEVKRIAVRCVCAWLFLTSTVLRAGGEPPPPFKLVGPAVVGTLVGIYNPELSLASFALAGECRGMQILVGPVFAHEDFSTWDESTLENSELIIEGQTPECQSDTQGSLLMIDTVTSFTNNGSVLVANVILRHLEFL